MKPLFVGVMVDQNWMVGVKATKRTRSVDFKKYQDTFEFNHQSSLSPSHRKRTPTMRKSLFILLIFRILECEEAFVVIRRTSKAASRFRLEAANGQPRPFFTRAPSSPPPNTITADVSNGKRQRIPYPLPKAFQRQFQSMMEKWYVMTEGQRSFTRIHQIVAVVAAVAQAAMEEVGPAGNYSGVLL